MCAAVFSPCGPNRRLPQTDLKQESFLFQIVAKLFGPTFLDEKVELYNFWAGLWSTPASFPQNFPYVSWPEPATIPSDLRQESFLFQIAGKLSDPTFRRKGWFLQLLEIVALRLAEEGLGRHDMYGRDALGITPEHVTRKLADLRQRGLL